MCDQVWRCISARVRTNEAHADIEKKGGFSTNHEGVNFHQRQHSGAVNTTHFGGFCTAGVLRWHGRARTPGMLH